MEKTFLKLDKTELTPIGTEKEEKITVHKGTWNKIDFTKLSVKAKDTSTTGTSTDSASGN
mgnify:CR=1 FL=1